jgi:hypothetical protein
MAPETAQFVVLHIVCGGMCIVLSHVQCCTVYLKHVNARSCLTFLFKLQQRQTLKC